MVSRGILVWAAALTAIAGCAETRHCPQGESYRGSGCVALDAAVVQEDVVVIDVGTDASADAGPCSQCVAGSTLSHCFQGPDAGPNGECVECLIDEDCDVTPYPDTGMIDAGAPLSNRLVCQDHRCVIGCIDGLNDCGGHVCRASDRQCSAYDAYAPSEAACAPCDTDQNCPSGFLCLSFDYQNGGPIHTGNYCLRVGPSCGAGTTPLGLTVSSPPTHSVDGATVTGTVCGPRSSCEALADAARNTTCATDDSCGLAGFDDGVCAMGGGTCTLLCTSTSTCPPSFTGCTGTPAVCTP